MSITTEHHAILTIDEPHDLCRLFDKGAEKLIMHLRGRTTISKKREIVETGISQLSHTYIDVDVPDLIVTSNDELKEIIARYKKYGINNVYAVRLSVYWGGDIHIWNRAVVHLKDRDMIRDSGSDRFNTLIIPAPSIDTITKYQNIYGDDVVKSTICESMQMEGTAKRYCVGVVPV